MPVNGKLHCGNNFELPALSQCCMATMMFFALATKSIAPPMPLTILPGTFQFAMSPFSLTSMAPKIVRSTFWARIIPKLMALSKIEEPSRNVTVCFPALIKSASSSPSKGKGPIPKIPFSLCNSTSIPSGM